jgi:hypothetical protein
MKNRIILPSAQPEAFHVFLAEKRYRKKGNPLKDIICSDNPDDKRGTIAYIIPSKECLKTYDIENCDVIVCRGITINENETPNIPEDSVNGDTYEWDYEYKFEDVKKYKLSDLIDMGFNPYDISNWSGYPQYWEV